MHPIVIERHNVSFYTLGRHAPPMVLKVCQYAMKYISENGKNGKRRRNTFHIHPRTHSLTVKRQCIQRISIYEWNTLDKCRTRANNVKGKINGKWWKGKITGEAPAHALDLHLPFAYGTPPHTTDTVHFDLHKYKTKTISTLQGYTVTGCRFYKIINKIAFFICGRGMKRLRGVGAWMVELNYSSCIVQCAEYSTCDTYNGKISPVFAVFPKRPK